MSTSRGSISMYRGDKYPITFKVKDAKTKALIDLTGYTAKLTVDSRENPTDGTTKLLEVAGTIVGSATAGTLSFLVSTEAMLVGTYYYDIQLTDPDGNIRTVKKDTFLVSQDITK